MERAKSAVRAFICICLLGAFIIEFLWSFVESYSWATTNYGMWYGVLAFLAVATVHIAIIAAVVLLVPTSKEISDDQNTPE